MFNMIETLSNFFYVDRLALLLMGLIGFLGLCIAYFASKYLKGDTLYNRFFVLLACLITSLTTLVIADHLALFAAAWGLSNFLLVKMMIHKGSWAAARASGRLAWKNFLMGCGAMVAAFIWIYTLTGETSIQQVIKTSLPLASRTGILTLLAMTALSQSAIWPFHKWLISSLNSPTPVSAMMHAGLVNGGGFLLARFAPLYLGDSMVLTAIFALGMLTAIGGTLWKLVQSDVKRQLACSTIGQMGFMMVQCGLGLFPAAIVHLCYHGVFKAYLFLASGGAAQEKRFDLKRVFHLPSILIALGCGCLGAATFSWVNHFEWIPKDTTLFLVVIGFIVSCQGALALLGNQPFKKLPLALCASPALGLIYGVSVYGVKLFLNGELFTAPTPLHALHLIALMLLLSSWLIHLFKLPLKRWVKQEWLLKGYVSLLNQSQPDQATITSFKKGYTYKAGKS
ncbi:proton-conducting transporter membrane subunit [Candidatus Neptunochlamydia vexilliferae]|uniref:Uncharacterized protein n=1 Tax=Candidatus Neptunichlamydia vexilliferae TaxID=1651774 RepID=A0ABS0AXH6_9BACT|nr:proton-conducting transporter membrane subunit [Candidatus Neptunochlamydia vexilliferae]MBF5058833.1 hypothetical protein [Candidatus Neptunochlamydia vexilliferae]